MRHRNVGRSASKQIPRHDPDAPTATARADKLGHARKSESVAAISAPAGIRGAK
jgi:hypothetical protein